MNSSVPCEQIESMIVFLRGQKVIMDHHLACLYGVDVKHLKRQVRRNIRRFPDDFMFVLTMDEHHSLRCQKGSLKRGAHSKYLPYAFTEQGVAMLSSVLNSETAAMVNIRIIRTFIKLREFLASHKELRDKLSQLEGRVDAQDQSISSIIEAIKKLLEHPTEEKRKIGFRLQAKRQV
ncbi:MAG: ORF6N domain-containing protein [Candidatus Wallbacteria bacterium]|nr:ORF6N domain-containing protein [Candidatus Wallbacteria bacterium]